MRVAQLARIYAADVHVCDDQLITFDILPDDVLLEIFDFYVNEEQKIQKWITLAHVCRRWRSVVFQSPHRLNLRLLCTPHTPPRDMILDVWPPLPLIIHDSYNILNSTSSLDNIISALEHNDRVSQIKLTYLTSPDFGYVTVSAAMQKPFPELTDLHLGEFVYCLPILPDSFLGGTAPRLRSLRLCDVPFPGLPRLLSSATHLVDLDLFNIPRSGYIPPEVMAASLSALTCLEFLRLRFRHPRPRPALESQNPPPPTRAILPNLTKILFKGSSDYLEEILARIDAPQLDELHTSFFNQTIFDTPQLFQFISQRPTLSAPEQGHIAFSSWAINVRFTSQTSDNLNGVLSMEIRCTASEWQLSSLEQVCASSLPPVSTLQDLYIFEDREYPPRWQDDVENTLWVDLLRPFVAVKNLYLSDEYASVRIAPALQELVGEGMTEILPTLENIFLEGFQPSGSLHEGMEKFVAARRLTSRPVAVFPWDKDSE